MSISLLLLLWLNFIPSISKHSTVEGWRGIVPMHSTRADVERLLGSAADECKCAYYFPDVNVLFLYSSYSCESGGAWDVPLDTVLTITVYPKPKPRWSDLNIDKAKFIERHTGHLEDVVSYVNKDEGLIIEVNRESGLVSGFFYEGAAKDQHLRCGKSAKSI